MSLVTSSPPPATRRDEQCREQFGLSVDDPYLWLENGSDPEVRDWIAAQNHWARSHLDALPDREALRRRLRELFSIGTATVPTVCILPGRAGKRCFYSRQSGEQPLPSISMRDDGDASDRVLLAPDEGGMALDWFHPSASGRYLAYGASLDGSEDSILRVVEVDTGVLLSDAIPRARFGSVCWLPGDGHFLYTRYPEPGSVPREEEWCHRAVFRHELGADPSRDPCVWRGGANDFPSVQISPDGKWVLLQVYRGWDRNDVYLAPAAAFGRGGPSFADAGAPPWRPVFVELEAISDVRFAADALFVRTSAAASRYRLLRLPLGPDGVGEATAIVDEQPAEVLQDFAVTARHVVLHYLADASSRLRCVNHDGTPAGEVALPTLGSCRALAAHPRDQRAYYDFMTFCRPAAVFELDPATGQSEVWYRPPASIQVPSVDISRLRARSADGTMVPMFVVRRSSDLRAPGPRPTLMIGYGGFNVSMLPKFEPASCTFVESGGTLVVANLRGGGEFGQTWYEAGARGGKSRVFQDAIACAEELIRLGLTTPNQLGLLGESHASLVALAVMVERPELVRAAVCASPLADMLRFHLHGVGRLWISEFGSPDEEESFAWLAAYSPYHRAGPREGRPAVLLTSGENDARTSPMHARKMAAALQRSCATDRPVFLLSSVDRGHGFGHSLAMQIEDMVDTYAFVFDQLGLALPGRPPG